jgi:hypothetical protein
MAFITKATYVFDVNSQMDIVEIEYVKYVHVNGWKVHKDWIYTYPEGDWTELNFNDISSAKYIDFLNSMVFKNLEVHRKIAKLSLDSLSKKGHKKLLKAMNAIRILDSTFIPPEINLGCTWQLGLLNHIVLVTSYEIIANCKNKKHLDRYSKVIQLI